MSKPPSTKTKLRKYIRSVTAADNQVTLIDLEWGQISDDGAASLSLALKHPNCKVTSINLGVSQISYVGAASLAWALKHPNCEVTSINFGVSQISDKGAEFFAEALKHPNCKVTSINLGASQISDKGALALAGALKDPVCKVEAIHLWENEISEIGALALAESLRDRNCKVSSIDLCRNKISHALLDQIEHELEIKVQIDRLEKDLENSAVKYEERVNQLRGLAKKLMRNPQDFVDPQATSSTMVTKWTSEETKDSAQAIFKSSLDLAKQFIAYGQSEDAKQMIGRAREVSEKFSSKESGEEITETLKYLEQFRERITAPSATILAGSALNLVGVKSGNKGRGE